MRDSYILNFNPMGNENRGYLVALEENENIPFEVKRIYYTYKVPQGIKRGLHAHENLEQVLVCINGSLKVKCYNGVLEETYTLNSPSKGLYIGNMVWREIYNYSNDAVLMVLASKHYCEKDYIRDYEVFKNKVKEKAGYKNIKLVEYDKEFLDLSWKWLQDEEIKKLTMSNLTTKENQLKWFNNINYRKDYLIYGLKYNDKNIGVVGLKNIVEEKSAEYFGYIGEKEYWGKKIGSVMMDMIIDIALKNKIKEIFLKVHKDNTRAIKLYESKKFLYVEKDKEILVMKRKI